MPVLYKTLFIIVLAATGVASVYALGTTGAIEAGLAAINSIIVEYGSQGGGMILSYAGAYNEYGEQVGYEVEVVAEGVSGIDIGRGSRGRSFWNRYCCQFGASCDY